MRLRDSRFIARPIVYEWAQEYWRLQQRAHWTPDEVSLANDLADWMSEDRLTDAERHVIETVLKGFTQVEVIVGEYWSSKVTQWFPQPEIVSMALAFANMETVHTTAYALLNDTLGLTDFEAFMEEPSARNKIELLLNAESGSDEDVALSLALFSAGAEGISLFSSFAILMNFSRFNLLKGMGKVVEWSVKDESLHSKAGCHLFREYLKDYPELANDNLCIRVQDALTTVFNLECTFIDEVFSKGEVRGLTARSLKNYMGLRTNTKYQELGYEGNLVHDVDEEAAREEFEWFNIAVSGTTRQDFFAGRVSEYAKIEGRDWHPDLMFQEIK